MNTKRDTRASDGCLQVTDREPGPVEGRNVSSYVPAGRGVIAELLAVTRNAWALGIRFVGQPAS